MASFSRGNHGKRSIYWTKRQWKKEKRKLLQSFSRAKERKRRRNGRRGARRITCGRSSQRISILAFAFSFFFFFPCLLLFFFFFFLIHFLPIEDQWGSFDWTSRNSRFLLNLYKGMGNILWGSWPLPGPPTSRLWYSFRGCSEYPQNFQVYFQKR